MSKGKKEERSKPQNELQRTNRWLPEGKEGGVKQWMGIEEGTCDEHWCCLEVLSHNTIHLDTNITLYVN